ncbi:MAG: CAP domain-containing protein [Minisyncoccia bacterium]
MNAFNKIKNYFWPNKANNFQPYILNDKIITVLILLFLLSKVLFSFQLILLQQSTLFADLNAQKIIALTNEVRQQYGLSPLKENPLLDEAAKEKAQDMFQNNYFAHFSPTGVSPWYWISKSGYNYHYAGENLAMNFIDSDEVVKAWLNSPGHRANLLNGNYQDIGIAILPADYSKTSGINQPLVVQLFGSPQATKTKLPSETTKTTKPSGVKITTSTTLPTIAQKEVLGEEKQLTPETIPPSTVTTMPLVTTTTASSQPALAPITTLPTNLEKSLQEETTRNQINIFNKFIAFGLIIAGSIVILGIILNQRAIPFSFSEIVLRGSILIFLGAAFLVFHLESFIGQLVVSSI